MASFWVFSGPIYLCVRLSVHLSVYLLLNCTSFYDICIHITHYVMYFCRLGIFHPRISYKDKVTRLKCPKYTEIHVFSKIWCFYACIQSVPRKYQALYNCYYSQIWSIVILWFGAYFNALKPSQKGKYVQKMSILSIF